MPEVPSAHATARTAAIEHRRRISLIAAGSAIFSLLFNWVATFYRDVRVSELFSDYADDGLCPTPESAIGVHCFGDFYAPMRVLTGEQGRNPWLLDGSWNYSPLSNWPMLPLVILRGVLEWRTLLLTYLVGAVGATVWAAFVLIRRSPEGKSSGSVLWLALVPVVSTPFLAAFDRGNTALVAVPLLMLGLSYLSRGQRGLWRTVVFLLAALKPQFGVLVLVDAAAGHWRTSLRLGIGIALAHLASFVVTGRDAWRSARAWINEGLGGYSFVYSDQLGDRNVSIGQYALDVTSVLDHLLFAGQVVLSAAPRWSPELVTIGVIALVAIALAGFEGAERLTLSMVVWTVVGFVGPILSFQYYLVFAGPLLLALMTGAVQISGGVPDGAGEERSLWMRPSLGYLLVAFWVVASFQIAVPMSDVTELSSRWGLVSRLVAGVLLLAFLSAVIATGLVNFLRGGVRQMSGGATSGRTWNVS